MSTDLTDPILRPPGVTENEAEFWGADADWTPTSPAEVRQGAATRRSRTRRWQRPLPAGSSARRAHGAPRRSAEPGVRQATGPAHLDDTDPLGRDDFLDFLDARFADDEMDWDVGSWDVDEWEAEFTADGTSDVEPAWADDWQVETRPTTVRRRRSVDTRLARVGLLTIAMTLIVAIAMALTSNDAADDVLVEANPRPEVAAEVSADAGAALTEDPQSVSTSADASAAVAASTAPDSTTGQAALTTTSEAAPSTAAVAAPVAEPEPATTVAACASEYEVSSGDFWIRIADAAGVRLADLLAVNGATIDTLLVPGRSICLPAGASTPAPPSVPSSAAPTTAGPATAAPTTATPATTPRTTVRPTTAAPTTAAPTTVVAPAAPADVEAIIRSVWPDELETKALAIAWRESNYVPTAKNYCCYGLFQIYWSVHRGWLDDMGVTSAEQLFDPLTNARAAYALYQRAGGFGPWGG